MLRMYTVRMSQKKLVHYEEFYDCIADILANPAVQSMAQYRHHRFSNTLEHSQNVAYYSYLACRKLGLDARSAARAGMLHDFFLYDWRTFDQTGKEHIYRHPKVALANAERLFDLNDIEREAIALHMWPAADARPTHPETYLISLIDKYCAVIEGTNQVGYFQKMRYAKLDFAIDSLEQIA